MDMDKKIITTPREIATALAKIIATKEPFMQILEEIPPLYLMFGILSGELISELTGESEEPEQINEESVKESEEKNEEMLRMRIDIRPWRKM